MANTQLLGLFNDAEQVVVAMDELKNNEFPAEDLDIYSGTPYPEGAFGEVDPPHRLFMFPLVGAMIGFAIGLLWTAGTQISYPLVTGGKPLLSIPPMTIIMYENTMLGAIIFTVLGVLFDVTSEQEARSIRDSPFMPGVETSTTLRFQNVVVRFTARLTGSPSVPALSS